jgi:hypothetical protein
MNTETPTCPKCGSTTFTSVHPATLAILNDMGPRGQHLQRTDNVVPTDPSQGIRCMCGDIVHASDLTGERFAFLKSEYAKAAA